MNDFAIRLRLAMERKNINASELSRLSGVGKNLISYYLHSYCLPKQDKCYLLAEALNVDPGWLMTGVEPDTKELFDAIEEELDNVPQTPEARILSRGIDKLNPEQRAQALAVVKAMFAQHPELFDD